MSMRIKSPWILHYNAGSCNGCDIEILACLAPRYDIERFGMINTGNPKKADILMVTGPVTLRSRERIVELYSQMPEPKIVIAIGACTCTGGVFRGMYHAEEGVDRYIPVDVYVPGCAAHPEQMIDGVVRALGIWEKKTKEMEKPKQLFGSLINFKQGVDRSNMAKEINTSNDDWADKNAN